MLERLELEQIESNHDTRRLLSVIVKLARHRLIQKMMQEPKDMEGTNNKYRHQLWNSIIYKRVITFISSFFETMISTNCSSIASIS